MDCFERKRSDLQMCENLRLYAAGYFESKEVSVTVSRVAARPAQLGLLLLNPLPHSPRRRTQVGSLFCIFHSFSLLCGLSLQSQPRQGLTISYALASGACQQPGFPRGHGTVPAQGGATEGAPALSQTKPCCSRKLSHTRAALSWAAPA